MISRVLALFAASLLLSCAGAAQRAEAPAGAPETAREIRWSGRVEVNGALKLPRGSKLLIEPGTTVVFGTLDSDGDGMGDASVTLEQGELSALGTREAPILFTSRNPAKPGQWGEIRMDFGRVRLAYAVIEGSTRGLHLHFTSGTVTDSIFRQNLDSTRLGESRVEFERCLFSQNGGKGFNARASTSRVENSWFRGNRRGIFLFEEDRGSRFSGNLLTGNDAPVRLGDFFTGDVAMTGSSLGDGNSPPPLGPAGYLSDPAQKARLTWTGGEARDTGPTGWPLLTPLWETPLGGFVDADAQVDETGAYVSDWGGTLYRLGVFDGLKLAEASLGDTVDSRVALGRTAGKSYAALQTWGRRVFLLDGETLKILDSFAEEESTSDDHRQSDPLLVGDALYVGTWAGRVHRFDVSGGTLRKVWSYDAGAPIRGGLALAGRNLLVPTEGGLLHVLDENGKLLWKADLSSPLLSAPLVVGNRAYLGSKGGKLTEFDLAEGKSGWATDLCGPAWYAPPAGEGTTLYQGDDGGCMSALAADTGKLQWRVKLDGGIRSRPAVLDNLLLVTTLGGSLYLLDRGNGFTLDRIQYAEQLNSSPVVLGNRVFFGGRDGRFRSLSVKTSAR